MVADSVSQKRTTVKDVNEVLNDHLQRHQDVYDPKLANHQVILFGEKNDDGLVHDVKDNSKIRKDVNELKLLVLGAIVLEIVMRFI